MNQKWLSEYINNPRYSTVWVGYTSNNRGRIQASHAGVWLGYQGGKCFCSLRFRHSEPKVKFGDHFMGMIVSMVNLFESMNRYIDHDSVILVSNKTMKRVVEEAQYKWLANIEYKSRLFFWMHNLAPQIQVYESNVIPFSILREIVREEHKNIANHYANRDFYNFTSWNEEC